MTSKLTQVGVVLLLLGATIVITPSFGFETLAADRGFDAATPGDENAVVGFEPTDESIDNRSDSAAVFRLRNNAGEELTFTTAHVLGIADLVVTDDGSGTVTPSNANDVTVECGDYGGDDEGVSITVTVTTASGDTLTVSDASASTSFAAFCNVPALVWETDSDWSDGATTDRTVSDGIGDRENDTVRLGYGVDDGNLVGYWPLDEDAGSTAADASGSGNDGTVNGDPVLGASGLLDATSYDFDGSDDYVSVPSSASLEPGSGVTVSAWVRRDGAQAQWAKPVFYGQNTESPWGPYGLQFDDHSDSNLHFHLGIDGSQSRTATVSLNDGEWHHVVGTFDGSTQAIYLDGREQDTVSVSGTIDDYDGTNGLGIGDRYEEDQPFDGNVDEVRIYDRGLSASEVSDLYYAADNGTHTTDWKTAEDEVHPGRLILDNVSTTLADGSASVTVQSDTDGDGTVDEESAPVELADDTDRYDVDGLTQGADRFRLQVDLSTPNLTRTPIVESVELTEDHSNVTVSVDSTNEPVVEGNQLDVDVTVENAGSDETTQTIELRDFDGTVVDSREVTLDGYEANASITLTWDTQVGDNGTADVTVASDDDTATRGVTVQQVPTFDVAIDGTNAPVAETDDLDVDVTVTNEGDLEDTQSIELHDFAGDVVDSRDETLGAGESASFTLAWSTSDGDAGTDTVSLSSDDDTATEEVTVEDLHLTSTCTTFDAAGRWRLTGNVTHDSANGNCFESNVDAVTFEGQGYEVDMDGFADDAFSLKRYDTDGDFTVKNVTVRGGNRGFLLEFLDNATLVDVTVVNANRSIKSYHESDQGDVGDVNVIDSAAYDASNYAIQMSGDGASTLEAESFTVGDPARNGSELSFFLDETGGGTELGEPGSVPSPPAGNGSIGAYFEILTQNDPLEEVRLHYDDGDVGDLQEDTLALWRDDGPWTQLDGSVDATNGTVSVASDLSTATTFGGFASEPPPFAVNVTGTNSPVAEGEALNATVDVTNNGDITDSQTIELQDFGGEVVDSTDVEVAAGGTETVALTWSTTGGDRGTGNVTAAAPEDSDIRQVTIEDGSQFDVTIDAAHDGVVEGEDLDVDVTVNNTGTANDTQTVELKDFSGEVVDSTDVSLNASEENASVTLTWATEVGDNGTDAIGVTSDDDSDTAQATIDQQATFDVNVTGTDSPVDEGETLTVDVDVTNTGDVQGTQTVRLEDFSGEQVDSTEVTLDAGSSDDSITLEWPTEGGDDGTGDVNVTSDDDFDTEEVTIEDGTQFDVTVDAVHDGVVEGEDLDVDVTVNNTGTASETQTIELEDFDGEVVDSTDVTLGAGETDSSITLTWGTQTGDDGTGDLNVTSDDDFETRQATVYERAHFDVNVTGTNEPVMEGEDLTVDANVTNTGDVQATQTIELENFDGEQVDSTDVTLDGGASDDSITLTWSTQKGDSGTGSVSVSSDNETDTQQVTVEQLEFFDVTIDSTNSPVEEGQDLTVDVTVENTGDRQATQTIELQNITGDVVDTQEVTLDGGQTDSSITLTWSTSTGDAGTDDVTVASENDTASEQVTIDEPGPVWVTDVEPDVSSGQDTQYFRFEIQSGWSGGEVIRINVSNADNSGQMSYDGDATVSVVNGSEYVQSADWDDYADDDLTGPRIKLDSPTTGAYVNVSTSDYTTSSTGGPWTVPFKHESASWEESSEFEIE